jgi:N-acetylglucosaminyldiphosphoundecaprenol N-acetyl-beta-D-mannosaminyltransferase
LRERDPIDYLCGRLMSHATILGIPVSNETHDVVLSNVANRIRTCTPGGIVSITNTESMYHALRRPEHMRYIQNAQHSLCDGVGVILAGWFWGLRIKRYNGPIFQLDCTERGAREGWRHFYLGGKPGVADEMALRLAEQYPGAQCVGTYAPPFRALTDEEDRELVAMINAAQPDFVWVGLGLLKQEQWIADHVDRIEAPWLVGVGAAFDYHSGAVPWAPPVLRALGLEWLFRLVLQPRLRARRYWWSLVFVVESAVKGMLRFFTRRPLSQESEAA